MRSARKALLFVGLLAGAAALGPLAGCSTITRATAPVVLQPPPDLTQDCQEPAGSVGTNQGVSVYLLDLRDALRGCNAQLGALRGWLTNSQAPVRQ